MIKKYKNIKDVPNNLRGDLDFLLEGKTFEERLNLFSKSLKIEIKNKDSKYESLESFLKALKKDEKSTIIFNKLFNYSSNKVSKDLNNVENNIEYSKLLQLLQKHQSEIGSESNRIYKNRVKIKKWLKDPKFKNYKYYFSNVIESFKYRLNDKVNDYLSIASEGNIDVESIFSIITNTELDLGFVIDSKGKKIKINENNLNSLLKHKEFKVRKESILKYKNAYLKHKNSLANILYQEFKSINVDSKIKGFQHPIDSLTFEDNVDKFFVKKLYTKVQNNNHHFKKYDFWFKKFYKAYYGEKATKYDLSRDIIKYKSKFTIEEAKEIVINSVMPFGKEYQDKVKEAFDNGWVDYMPAEGKRQGAYSIGSSFGVEKKHIHMNFEGDLKSVLTLSHEMGHSMHSYFSDNNNILINSQYPIFQAEIASIFHELITYDYLLKTSNNKKFKFRILQEIIEGFQGTVIYQTTWSNFEYDLYDSLHKGEHPKTYSQISKIFINNKIKYLNKKNPKLKEEDAYNSIRVPHFFAGFYVYKYAIGQIVANIFYNNYLTEGKVALDNYIKNFLSAGCRENPVDLIKKAGADLNNENTYDLGFEYLKNAIEEWVKLGKEIYKDKI
ncbi:MAG: oligoendopeptidase F [Mollicutes bacterium PWAP]|nr:oligoendopeptidase F [Mollicutes bacterium PWAP]